MDGPKSTLGIKYPSFRDHPFKSASTWLNGKRADDGAENLWRIHDNLYDLNDFAKSHPGGSFWIETTRGTDVTEAFETHHLTQRAPILLPDFFKRKAKVPRNVPFTFKEDGFYKTLKRKIVAELPKVPRSSAKRSQKIADLLLLSFLMTAVLSVWHKSYVLGALSGVILSLNTIAAHNFFHQRDNFRMYYFDMCFMQSRNWRITHAMSHHLYTNTVNDVEISFFEPFLYYLPIQKHPILKYLQWIVAPILCCFLTIGYFLKSLVTFSSSKDYTIFLPFTTLLLMAPFSTSVVTCVSIFLWIQIIASFHFGMVGINAAHHHPDLFHDGDSPRLPTDMDWGVYQLDCVMDRNDITGSHFLVITHFGDHALHHLFPTLDHGLLEYLYPVFLKTCEDFGIRWKVSSQLELAKGHLQQLIKSEPTKEPPIASRLPG